MSISPSMVAAQWRNLPIVPKGCTGQTFIVSGSNTGIGLEAAKHFVRLGAARVIIAVRSASKGEAAKDTIESATGRTGVVEVWPLDLASNDSIRAFAKRASTELDRIDAVLENAGVAFAEFTQAEGTETTIQVNVIGTFLLAILLLPALKASAERWSITPHLTIVSSGAHCSAQFAEAMHDDIFAALSQASTSNMADRYALSKLLEVYAARQLARLAPASRTGVVVNLLSPGLCNTDLTRNVGLLRRAPIHLLRLFLGRSAEMGSRTLLHAAVAGPESHGQFCADCEVQEHKTAPFVRTDEGRRVQKRVWDGLVARLEAIEPGCVSTALAL